MSHLGRLAVVAALCVALGGCESCGASDHVAELRETTRTVERDYDAARETWEGAEVGARFAIGDGVRTGSESQAMLTLGRDGSAELRLEESSAVRFLSRPGEEEGALVDVNMGAALIEAGDDGFSLHTQFGTAILQGGSRARLSAGDDGLDFSVMMGSAVFDGEEERELSEGDSIHVDMGGAIIDPEPEPTSVSGGEPEPETEPEAEPEAELEPATGGTVRRLTGRGGQIRASEGGSYERLGDESVAVENGARIRVSRRSTVELVRGGVRTVLRGSGEFVVGGEGGELVRAESGGVSVETSGRDVAISVPGGTIVARAVENGSATEVDVRRNGSTQVRATRGQTEIRGRGEPETLGAGESGELSARGDLAEVGGRGPARADFVVGAFGRITVHDPRPPTALGIRFGDGCPGRGVIELMRGGRARASSTGEGSANLSLPSGTHSYRIRCATADGFGAEPVATGSVRVVRDTGVNSLPPSAPTTFIDTDGRTYRVMYQTHLPDIVVRWPRAPSGGPYVLTVTGGRGPQTFRSAQPRVQLESGTLRVGSYRLRFGNGSQQSRDTPVEVRFDNAMSTATIRSPRERSFSAGESVDVEGIALPGWRVIVGGRELEPSAGSRFSTTTTAPTATDGFVIELRHPSRGRHFYVRRARGSE